MVLEVLGVVLEVAPKGVDRGDMHDFQVVRFETHVCKLLYFCLS